MKRAKIYPWIPFIGMFFITLFVLNGGSDKKLWKSNSQFVVCMVWQYISLMGLCSLLVWLFNF